TFQVSNTHRVHPSSIGAAYERYRPTLGASGPAKPGYPGLAAGGSTGAERPMRSESRAATAVTPISNGSVWAVTSYGGSGGPPGRQGVREPAVAVASRVLEQGVGAVGLVGHDVAQGPTAARPGIREVPGALARIEAPAARGELIGREVDGRREVRARRLRQDA